MDGRVGELRCGRLSPEIILGRDAMISQHARRVPDRRGPIHVAGSHI